MRKMMKKSGVGAGREEKNRKEMNRKLNERSEKLNLFKKWQRERGGVKGGLG